MANLPALEASATLLTLNINSALAFPALEMSGSLEIPSIHGVLVLPAFETVGMLSVDKTIFGNLTLPSIEVDGTLFSGQMIEGALILPSLGSNGILSVQVDVNAAVAFPPFEATGTIDRSSLSDWGTRPRNEVYTCVISAVGYDDITPRISSWQARFRTDAESYIAVVVPGIEYYDAIADRAAGTITVYKGYDYLDNDETVRIPIIVADIDSILNYEGPRNASVTISGYTTLTETPKSVTIDDLFYRGVRSDGTVVWRTSLYINLDDSDFFIKPGDTVTYGSDSLEVGYISIAVSTIQEVMELSGA